MNDKKLISWYRIIPIAIAACVGIAINGYRTYRNKGELDGTWYVIAAISLIVMFGIAVAVIRHGNKPEQKD